MSIKYEIVHAVRVRLTCNCGGEYVANGRDDLTHNKFGHRCASCGSEMKSDTKFPAIEHFTEAELAALATQA
ncbi:hypothetical protein [Phaeobacter phage MD18]|nr:hypothetical protein [Phaeobacter phage MD18]